MEHLFVLTPETGELGQRFTARLPRVRTRFGQHPQTVVASLALGHNVVVHDDGEDWRLIAGHAGVPCILVGIHPAGQELTLPVGYAGFVNLDPSGAYSVQAIGMLETATGTRLLSGSLVDVLDQAGHVSDRAGAGSVAGFRATVLSQLPELLAECRGGLGTSAVTLTLQVKPIHMRPLTRLVITVPVVDAEGWVRDRGLPVGAHGALRVRLIGADGHAELRADPPPDLHHVIERLKAAGAICVAGRTL